MRVGVHVYGFNLYYGARGLCGRGTPGWRWLDLRALATDLVGGQADQDVYLKAPAGLGQRRPHRVRHLRGPGEDGAAGGQGPQGRPELVVPDWPVMVQDGVGGHWWSRLRATDLTNHQLPDPAGSYRRPAGW